MAARMALRCHEMFRSRGAQQTMAPQVDDRSVAQAAFARAVM